MKKGNKKQITIKKSTIIILIVLLILLSAFAYFSTDIVQYFEIIFHQNTNLSETLTSNETLLGITDVKGQGVKIDILDGTDLIHQEDLIIMIDELKNAGAQAIAINNQRITNSSYIYCDGSVILLDGEKIGNPFCITAIGDSETIYGALMRNKGYISTLQNDGVQVSVEKSDNIEIQKTKNNKLLNYGNNKTKIGKIKKSNQLIGKASVKGKGVDILITENQTRLSSLYFMQIINDLKSAGVEAISLNDNRITNMTDFMDISNKYILVNSVPISAPYLIKAIGNPKTRFNEDALRILRALRFKVKMNFEIEEKYRNERKWN